MTIKRFFAYLVALVILLMPLYRLMLNMNIMAFVMALMLVKMIADWSIKLIHAVYKAKTPRNS